MDEQLLKHGSRHSGHAHSTLQGETSDRVVDGTAISRFRDTFGLTIAQTNFAEINPNLTLLAAIKLQGGMRNALARHCTSAALSSSTAGSNSRFTVDQVLNLVHDAFVALDPNHQDAMDRLTAATNLDHSSCPAS